jgi:hypothetical protein
MRTFILFILIGILNFSCINRESNTALKVEKDSIEKEKLKYTVINDSLETKWISDDYKRFWIPTQAQIDIVDSITIRAIKINYKDYYRHLKPDSLKNFYRQYVCYIDSIGDSIVYLNAICYVGYDLVFDKNNNVTQKKFDWQHHLMIVDDGGDCFWSIYINLTKKKYFSFSVNGMA